MKTRNGFVSNSSSSSFIVRIRDNVLVPSSERRLLLTDEEIEKLVDYGFVPICWPHTPSQIEHGAKVHRKRLKDAEMLCYSVVCNEDWVLAFLMREDIPFVASTHYGHSSIFYERGKSYYTVIPNDGVMCEMYGFAESNSRLSGIGTKPMGAKRLWKSKLISEVDMLDEELDDS